MTARSLPALGGILLLAAIWLLPLDQLQPLKLLKKKTNLTSSSSLQVLTRSLPLRKFALSQASA